MAKPQKGGTSKDGRLFDCYSPVRKISPLFTEIDIKLVFPDKKEPFLD
jgi:hypothetical protein